MKVIHLTEIDSTNDYVFRHAQDFSYPLLVYADYQTAGKGRLGRHWHSDSKGFWASYAWVWPKSMSHLLPLLSLHLGLLVHQNLKPNLDTNAHDFEIKWPNDLYLRGRKLGGILIETRPFKEHLLVVIGLGVNYTAASLPDAIGFAECSSVEFEPFRSFLIAMFRDFSLELLLRPEDLMAQLNQVLAFRGKKVSLTHADELPIEGVLLGVNAQGFLQIDRLQEVMTIQTTDWSVRLST